MHRRSSWFSLTNVSLSQTHTHTHRTLQVLVQSYDRFIQFVKRSSVISPTIALETATTLQNKIEEVTRRAQEQFQMVLEVRKVEQVVSPEFTFYDNSKSFLDDSTYGEKLLRAKTDFGLMYTSKEDHKWIRGLLKDLIVEAGYGLVILDPVDVSGDILL